MSEDASRVGLTLRESEVVRLVAEGYTYWEITDMLAVGSGFVRACLDRIYWNFSCAGVTLNHVPLRSY